MSNTATLTNTRTEAGTLTGTSSINIRTEAGIFTVKDSTQYYYPNYITRPIQNVEVKNTVSTDYSFNSCYKDLINKYFISPNEFSSIKEYVPNKVYGFTFNKGDTVKTICDESDNFDLEYAFYLALAKHFYKDEYTFEGILNKVQDLMYKKDCIKIVKRGMKLFEKQKEEKRQEQIKQDQIKSQKAKKIRKKQRKQERNEQAMIKAIVEGIKQAKK